MDKDAHLTAFLAEHGAECPVCGYALDGITRPACPECAAPLALAISSPNLGFGPLITAIVALALAVGFDGVFSLLMTIPIVFEPGAPTFIFILWFGLIALGLVSLLLLIALATRRKQWQRKTRRAQWIRAIFISVVVFLVHAAFGGGMMYLAQGI